MRVGVVFRDVVRDLITEAADDDAVEKRPLAQRRVQPVRRRKPHRAAVLDLNDVAVLAGSGQIVQHLIERQNAQLVRHSLAVEIRIRRIACVRHKLRRHIQLLELCQRFLAHEHALRAEHRRRVRHAVERIVVREYQHIVRRHVQVKLKIIDLRR